MNLTELPLSVDGTPSSHVRYIVRNGKHRRVFKPNGAMERLHAKLLVLLRRGLAPHMPSSMCQRDVWSVKNLLLHKGNRYFFKIDIKNAYPSTNLSRLAHALCALDPTIGTEEEVQRFLVTYCGDGRGGLAQGLPAAQDLFNIYCDDVIDGPLRWELAMGWEHRPGQHVVYTRYVDDLIISDMVPIHPLLVEKTRSLLAEAGFRENRWKTRFVDVHKHGPMVVTGRSLDRYGTIRLSRKREFALEGMLHAALKLGDDFEPPQKNPKKPATQEQVLCGHMEFFLETIRTRKYYSSREWKILNLYARWAMSRGVDVSRIAEMLHRAN
jgi:hypothetical protein